MCEGGHAVDVVVGQHMNATIALKRLEDKAGDLAGSGGFDGGLGHLEQVVDSAFPVVNRRLQMEHTASLREIVAARGTAAGSHGSSIRAVIRVGESKQRNVAARHTGQLNGDFGGLGAGDCVQGLPLFAVATRRESGQQLVRGSEFRMFTIVWLSFLHS